MSALDTAAPETSPAPVQAEAFDPAAYVQQAGGLRTLHLMVEGVHCGGCVQRIERALRADPAVERARVNLTTRRLVVSWRGAAGLASRLVGTLAGLGYRVVPYDPARLAGGDVAAEKQLLLAMAVAGFAAGNVMLLSVSVWAGHVQGMGAATRDLLHWFSALIALPAVQVIASGRLLARGVLLKSATALERVAHIDTVVLDKTGTLTHGQPDLAGPVDGEALRLAASLAGTSRHPLARALCRAMPGVPVADSVEEVAGRGLRLGAIRLGSRVWCGLEGACDGDGPELWLARPDRPPVRFAFRDQLRSDAAAVIAQLKRRGLQVELLSGDRAPVVAGVAQRVGIARWRAGCTPADKAGRLEQLAAEGRRVLMVGDGLNDAPALAGAYVSASPSSAADVSQTAADAVFQGERLGPVVALLDVARKTDRLIRQNVALALIYNLITVPIAIVGLVTPLVAALCMSASSLLVVGNALRLRIGTVR